MPTPMQITIGGSYRKHFSAIIEHKREFERLGARVLRPASEEIIAEDGGVVRLHGDPTEAEAVAEAQRRAINHSDALYVVNPGGYVGPSAIAEMGYAYALGVLVATSEPPYERAAGELTTHVGSPIELVDFLPKDALALSLRERRLFGAIARQNLAPWMVAGTDWRVAATEQGYHISHRVNGELVEFAAYDSQHGWSLADGVSAHHSRALRELLLQYGHHLPSTSR